MSERPYNFSAGPAMLPESVLEETAENLLDFNGSGIGIAEIGHRSDTFTAIVQRTEDDLRDLMSIPSDYDVMFLQGGATGQFAAVPFNLAGHHGVADYVVTGLWGEKAVKEAEKLTRRATVAARPIGSYTSVPDESKWELTDASTYVHITPNETINGVQFDGTPDVGDHVLVADMSSMILSEPVEVEKYGVIYAGAQKNIGPAGLTVVIARRDLLGGPRLAVPTVWDWKAQAENHSAVNTPPTLAIYMAGLVFKWLKKQGGVPGIAAVNQRKAALLYETIDGSELYSNPVEPANRSSVNVPFLVAGGLEKVFLKQAAAAGLVNLEGHRSVGGLRASIYNAMPEEGVRQLAEFMRSFEAEHS